jgi:hypothetical protein
MHETHLRAMRRDSPCMKLAFVICTFGTPARTTEKPCINTGVSPVGTQRLCRTKMKSVPWSGFCIARAAVSCKRGPIASHERPFHASGVPSHRTSGRFMQIGAPQGHDPARANASLRPASGPKRENGPRQQPHHRAAPHKTMHFSCGMGRARAPPVPCG